ncbi:MULTISPECIES: hypothetical protein [Photobacterium]|uniref:Uncharacterized protein n=3 Tax=Photobacterium TaxID=657 RepID=A0A2T3MF65_9GAMM|nr:MULTISPECIES: hypothetical protein [Photobacterium]MCD9468963.1 hypothetical protein [Photobacterium iliopiscarium]MCD9489155.1 hypothetical protein [Photobacterium iliopiscarium]MCD9528504.1 hypothetical protein [Photobacterium carnosum]PLC55983.1 hypothetical protein CIK00_20860 [Photobacterium carnosum]PSV92425.1 hypothetical protein C9I88_16380 [Photobacterium iliopiscarium]
MRINTKLLELPNLVQQQIEEDFTTENYLSSRHCSLVHFMNDHYLRPDSYRSIDDPSYRSPTLPEITEVIEHLASIHSLTIVAKQLGIIGVNQTRTLRRWQKGINIMPYSAWRLLLILDGRVVEVNRIIEEDGSKPWTYNYEDSKNKA